MRNLSLNQWWYCVDIKIFLGDDLDDEEHDDDPMEELATEENHDA